MATNPYHHFVSSFADLVRKGRALPLGGIPAPAKSTPKANAPVGIIFSPHPDDECVTGGLALRLMRETGMRIINIPVTLGSNPERRQPRLEEVKNACDWLGFELELPAPGGLEKINPATRAKDPKHWAGAVEIIAAILMRHQPRVIFFPHEGDANTTHIGAHFLVMDALKTLPANFQCLTIETEFWGPMPHPNLMVESNVQDVADLVSALSLHIGEVERNPYHLRLPAGMMENVRRGSELVGGQGSAAPDFIFATLYQLRRWKNGSLENMFAEGKQISATQNVAGVVPGIS
ncbi:MAG TPA: PIG-L family deacetylase [Verrucomicrobiae bacterium]|jgi:LmbE family N-acetylglucosaminyl deacetylase